MDKKALIKIGIAALLFLGGILTDGTVSIVLLLISYVTAGYGPIIEAVTNIAHGQIFDENFLMAVASIGAIALGEYDEACAVMIFYMIGEFFEDYAVDKSRKSIAELMNISPDTARVLRNDAEETVDPYDVAIGEIIIVRPGEKIPLDGVILEGNSSVDTSALTGESVPQDLGAGDKAVSGCINMTGLLKIKVESGFSDSTVSKVLEMVEEAASRKAPAENFITRFARIYTPAVVFSAIALALIPPIVSGGEFSTWIYRACLFLVVSCPCALVISVPMGFFSGIGSASSKGILVKGGNYLQVLSELDTVMFDKTGTLTTGEFHITEIESDRDDFLKLMASIEQQSNHPIARSIKREYEGSLYELEEAEEIAGRGLRAVIDGKTYYAGNAELMKDCGFVAEKDSSAIYAADENGLLGHIKAEDTVKPNMHKALLELKKYAGRLVMLTGDNEPAAAKAAEETGITEYYAGLLPGDKVSLAEKIISESKGRCAFTGDGINDAPVLARADLGIAMGGLGSQAAMEAADVVIMDDDISKLGLAIRIGKKTLRLCRENIWFAIGIKLIVLALGALGLVNMWAAVFADVGVAILCILNSMRALTIKY